MTCRESWKASLACLGHRSLNIHGVYDGRVKRASIPGIRSEMNSEMRKLQVLLLFTALSITSASAQKVKTGYDKTADFSKYKSFSLREPTKTPNRPILYASVMGTITDDLKAKGLTQVDKGGDL